MVVTLLIAILSVTPLWAAEGSKGNENEVQFGNVDEALARSVKLYGWVEDVHCWESKKRADPSIGTKHCLLMEKCAASGYGIIFYDANHEAQFYKFDEAGNKLTLERFINTTQKENDLTVIVQGTLKGELLHLDSILETDEKEGVLARKSLFDKDQAVKGYTRDQLVIKEGGALDYGIIVKEGEGYQFYLLEGEGQTEAKNIVNWYEKYGEDEVISILVQGVYKDQVVTQAKVFRNRTISGSLASLAGIEKGLKLADYTKDYLLSEESLSSGYGYFVQDDQGYSFLPFDKETSGKVKELLKASKIQGTVHVNVKGYWYWKGKTIKVSSVEAYKESTYEGILQDRHCFGKVRPEIDTKMCLSMDECRASGYGIVVKTLNGENSFYAFDKLGNEKVEAILKNTTKDSNITIRVTGKVNGNLLQIESIEEIN